MKENQKTNLELSKNLNYALLNLKKDIEDSNKKKKERFFYSLSSSFSFFTYV